MYYFKTIKDPKDPIDPKNSIDPKYPIDPSDFDLWPFSMYNARIFRLVRTSHVTYRRVRVRAAVYALYIFVITLVIGDITTWPADRNRRLDIARLRKISLKMIAESNLTPK